MPRIFFKVTAGTIKYRGHVYSAGAEFPATERTMDEYRAQGVVTRITERVIYRVAAKRGTEEFRRTRRVRALGGPDNLMTMSRNALYYVKHNMRFVTSMRKIFPELTGNQIRYLKRGEVVKLIVAKRGF
jgi:hypothetical protein